MLNNEIINANIQINDTNVFLDNAANFAQSKSPALLFGQRMFIRPDNVLFVFLFRQTVLTIGNEFVIAAEHQHLAQTFGFLHAGMIIGKRARLRTHSSPRG